MRYFMNLYLKSQMTVEIQNFKTYSLGIDQAPSSLLPAPLRSRETEPVDTWQYKWPLLQTNKQTNSFPVQLTVLKIFHLPLNFEIPVSFTCWLVAKTVGISKFSYKRKIFNNWTGKLLSLKFIFATGGWGILNKVQKTLFAFWLETNVMIMIEEWWQSEKQKIGPWKKR